MDTTTIGGKSVAETVFAGNAKTAVVIAKNILDLIAITPS
jgi:hypothetical protein